MATIDERFHVFENSLWKRLARDVRLLRLLASIVFQWFKAGGRVRKAYRQAVTNGRVMQIDMLAGRGKYD